MSKVTYKEARTVGYEIEIVDAPALSREYISERTRIWNCKVKEGSAVGKVFFNGSLYRFMGIRKNAFSRSVIQLCKMTYADRLMKTVVPIGEIHRKYGKEHVMLHCCVDAILSTTDGKVVYGVKKLSVDLKPGKIGYVSGNMNADEVNVNEFEDIYTMMMKEIGEETSLTPLRKRLSFIHFGRTESWVAFYFLYRTGLHSRELIEIEKDDEFDHFETASLEEVIESNRTATSDFDYSKRFLPGLQI